MAADTAPLDRSEGSSLSERMPPKPQMREVLIPIRGVPWWPALRATFPLTEDSWNQMIAVLNAMKPGLVGDTEQAGGNDPVKPAKEQR